METMELFDSNQVHLALSVATTVWWYYYQLNIKATDVHNQAKHVLNEIYYLLGIININKHINLISYVHKIVTKYIVYTLNFLFQRNKFTIN